MLPVVVRDFLSRLDAKRVQPVVVQLDNAFRLKAIWGNAASLGLPCPKENSDLRVVWPFLTGMQLDHADKISHLDGGNGHAIDLHILPQDESCTFLVLSSVLEQTTRYRQLQQQANESRLLYQKQKKLVDQLIATKSELEMRRREAEEAMRVKSQFLASMSHEFRTPLTSVIGYAEWLSEAMGSDEQARRQARAIVRAGQHMVSLVDNILEQARLENSEAMLHDDTVDLRQIAEDMSAIMAPLAADKGLAFAAFLEPQQIEPVVVDEMRLRQILINLLGNAVKFTEEGFVQLSLSWSNGQLHAEVADSGPGIPEDDRSRIFSAFERLEGSHKSSGAGLGLHITLKLVKLLGGSIGLDSQPGDGSRFHIRLPAPLAESDDVAEPAAAPGGRLVIAEDDPDVVQLMQLFLSRAGYQLDFAVNGREAVDKVAATKPDLVILDLNMPVMDGISAVQKLRESGHTGPVIALTGATLDEDRIRAIEAGFDGYVAKPIRMPELIETVRTLIA
ncbi:MAG: response regulator [Gammaproteobacteria bacterium]|nr:response regulator [Gammaproteobacteria bacterium]